MPDIEARVILSDDRAVAFFFGRHDFRGILVKAGGSSSFGVLQSKAIVMSDRVAVYCLQR